MRTSIRIAAIAGRSGCAGPGTSLRRAICSVIGLALYAAAVAQPVKPEQVLDDEEDSPAEAKMSFEEKVTRRACTRCHAFVEPNMLTRQNWQEQILPRMSVRLGVKKADFASSPEGELIRSRKVYTEHPLVPVDWWPVIEKYYLDRAPEQALPQAARPEIEIGLKDFRTEPPRFRTADPSTTLVKIRAGKGQVFVGDDKTKALFLVNADGSLANRLELGNVPVDVTEVESGIYVTCVGSFLPSEIYRAEMLFFPKQGNGFGEKKVILKELPRASQAQFADFNGDGKLDFALCMFGNITGRFSWFENLGADQYKEHVLSTETGAMYCSAKDFDGDGDVDLAVLFAQHIESLLLLKNDGKGKLVGNTLFQKPPVWGHSYMEAVDFNRDGKLDFLVTNGDNGEYVSPLKNYHGIRLYIAKGNEDYEENLVFPLNGAYKAMAFDFDGDGDLDIAAISYFPDYDKAPRECFVLLENLGNMKFAPRTFRECISGRWLTMDVGDLDGDGAPDIVLGSYIHVPFTVPQFLMTTWEKYGASIVVLHNSRKPAAPAQGGASH